jgi:solute carrier family 45, member 1/2/4
MARLSWTDKASLSRLWAFSHFLFVIAIFSTAFVSSYIAGLVLLSLVGASWAITIWVPFVLIGYDVTRLSNIDEYEIENLMGNGAGRSGEGPQDRIGGIMGLHNMAISLPQILSALIISALFYTLPLLGLTDVIGWVIRAGSVASFGAACMVVRLLQLKM